VCPGYNWKRPVWLGHRPGGPGGVHPRPGGRPLQQRVLGGHGQPGRLQGLAAGRGGDGGEDVPRGIDRGRRGLQGQSV